MGKKARRRWVNKNESHSCSICCEWDKHYRGIHGALIDDVRREFSDFTAVRWKAWYRQAAMERLAAFERWMAALPPHERKYRKRWGNRETYF